MSKKLGDAQLLCGEHYALGCLPTVASTVISSISFRGSIYV